MKGISGLGLRLIKFLTVCIVIFFYYELYQLLVIYMIPLLNEGVKLSEIEGIKWLFIIGVIYTGDAEDMLQALSEMANFVNINFLKA